LVAWADPRYPVSKWSSGLAPIGTGTTAATKSAPVRTIYFKKTFDIVKKPKALGILVKITGGASVTLNNHEVGRINLPSIVTLNYNTDPTSSSQVTKIFTLDSVALSHLKVGANTLAVEVHAASSGTIDGFDSKVFDEVNTMYVALGSQWNYFDNGYKPADMKLGDITSVFSGKNSLPESYCLYGNYPNPFNPTTVIRYDIPKNSDVAINVFDILGRKVATLIDQNQNAGTYELHFDGSRLASGIYILQMKAGDFYKTHKMMLVK
jgi:hypothetical protein